MSAPPLDLEQRSVVSAGPGPMLVVAGAGTGKTRTLTWRVAALLAGGEEPHRICLLTFTNRAASHMISAVRELGYEGAPLICGGTFHGIAQSFLSMYPERVGFDRGFRLLDADEAVGVLGRACARWGVGAAPERMFSLYSWCVNTQQRLDESVLSRFGEHRVDVDAARGAFVEYMHEKASLGVMDLDDLLLYFYHLLGDVEIGARLSERFRWVLVDEYQDANALQSAIVARLAARHRNVVVVGDDAQAIYGFRGADVGNLLSFREVFPEASVATLSRNYRCSAEIVALANGSIRHNVRRFDKALVSVSGPSGPVVVALCRDVEGEARFVAQRILELTRGGVPAESIAVLYRTHRQVEPLIEALSAVEVPHGARHGGHQLVRGALRPVIEVLQLAARPRDMVALGRVVAELPGVGRRTVERVVAALAVSEEPAVELGSLRTLKLLPTASHDRLRALAELVLAVHQGRVGCVEAVRRAVAWGEQEEEPAAVALLHQARGYRQLQDLLDDLRLVGVSLGGPVGVTLSTVHQAKGLEWTVVFVVGLGQGLFPLHRLDDPSYDEEEERRLFFVAVTRAKRSLVLTVPGRVRGYDGRFAGVAPSRFVEELGVLGGSPQVPVEVWRVDDEGSASGAR